MTGAAKTYRDIWLEGRHRLEEAGVAEAGPDAWYLFEECFEMDRASWLLRQAEAVGDGQYEQICAYFALIARRAERIPLQQITGHQEFMGLDFKVNECVLIPRQDTEVLVEEVLRQVGSRADEGGQGADGSLTVLDMCTGSGCIGISIAALLKGKCTVSLTLADLSAEALLIAEENARRLLDIPVSTVKGDLFEKITGKYDFIVSNPPYIPSGQIDELMEEVRDHEPRMALDGRRDGLYFYRRLAAESTERLVRPGRLCLEIGYDQGEAVSGMLREHGFSEIRVLQDLAGLDRVVTAVYR